MPPDDRERSELDEALFSDGRADPPPDPAPRPASPEQDLPDLEAALFGEATAAADPTDPSADVEPPLEWASEPVSVPEPAAELDPEADSTAVFAAVPPPPPMAEPVVLSRRQRRRAAGAERGSGRGKRLGFAALVVLLVVGLGGLAYAALGSDDGASPTKGAKVEVRGTQVTRTTLRPTTSSSSTTTSSTSTSTSSTSTTKPTATTRAAVPGPATEPPATDPPVIEQPPPTEPPPTEPPTVPTTQPPPPPTTTTTTIPEPPPAT